MKEKICEFCGEPFVPRSNFQRYCKRPHYMNCPICGKQYLVTNNENLKRPPVACSYECRTAKREQTSMERYGIKAPGNNPEARAKTRAKMIERYGAECTFQVKEFAEKAKATMVEKYGAEHPMKVQSIKDKVANTCIERYGTKTFLNSEEGNRICKQKMIEKYGQAYPLQNSEIKEKYNATCNAKYGSNWFVDSEIGKSKIHEAVKAKYDVDSVMQLESVKDKTKKTFIERYGTSNPSKNPDVKAKIKQSMIDKYGTDKVLDIPEIKEKIMKTSLERYGVPFYIMLEETKKSSGAISKLNMQFKNELDLIGIQSELEHRIDSSSYDFYIPCRNMLIELNPSYTHNLIGNHWDSKGKDRLYHFNRCKLAHKNGFDIICIFDWDSKTALLDELSATTIDVDENSLESYVINRRVGIEFLTKYGRCRLLHYPRKTMFLGLVKDNVLYSCICIGLNSSPVDKSYRILNYGYIWGCTYPLGLNKLIRFATNWIDIEDMCFRVDLDRIRWKDIESIGLDSQNIQYDNPIVYWSRNRTRIPYSVRKDNSINIESGWLPVEDCGQAVFTFHNLKQLTEGDRNQLF